MPDEAVREAIRRGICKVNYATELRIAYSDGVKEVLNKNPETIDPKKYGAAGKERVMSREGLMMGQGIRLRFCWKNHDRVKGFQWRENQEPCNPSPFPVY